MRPFDVCGPLPDGTTLLEASAGTGKTFTIAALTARYVAEGVAELDQLMLVTFGNAASRELRDRVRERLVVAERGLREPAEARASDDDVLRLLAGVPDEQVALRRERLARALAGFDGATISTTHSFCSQMLAGLGVVADTDPSAVFAESLDDLVAEVVDDLYLRSYARDGAAEPALTHPELRELGSRAVGDRSARLGPADADGVAGQRRAAAAAVREEVERRKLRLGLVDYDDWLVRLRDALADPERGEVARERVRSRYRVVLVDEFQDTDPVQWDVLRLAFHGVRTLVLIGDPKQAIYAFRGGDVTTYLDAAAVSSSAATLQRSWRSDADLLAALEQLLGGAALGDDRIVVRPVEAAHRERRLLGAGPPLRLRQVHRPPPPAGAPRVDEVRERVAQDVAADVVGLLQGGVTWCGSPLLPRDVAVLVRTNKQGALVRAAFERAGVPAVLAGGGSVFATPSARSWLVLLEAMEQPHRSGRVRAAALSVFLGRSRGAIDGDADDVADELGPRLRAWADLLAERGVAAFFEVLTGAERLPQRVLARPDGERVLTDLRHVAQALHAESRTASLGLTALVAWLRRRIAAAQVEGAEDRTRRLESDAAAVQVMTVHVSKGLEFPVVYVPFGWDRWQPKRQEVLRLHDGDGERVLDVGGPADPAHRESKARAEAEETGEELRLLYVALTRAQGAVVAHWAATANTATAPLHRLLFGAEGAGRVPRTVVRPLPDVEADRVLERLAGASGGCIAAEVADGTTQARWDPDRPATPALAVSRLTRRLDTAWRRTSYTALTVGGHESPAGVGSEPDVPGKGDEPEPPEDAVADQGPAAGTPGSPLAALPRGPAFGTLVHEVLEDTDPAALDGRCADAVARRPGSRVSAAALADGLRPVLHTPLAGTGTTLAAVAPGDRLEELDFELPLGAGDAAATLADLAALLGRYDLGPLAAYPALLGDLEPSALRGFLTGSVDALLRLPGPSYVVVDYKTNWLGGPDEALTAWHYRAEAMTAEMLRAHYPLQALLYTVAVHRFLRWRQPGYDPDRHLGGVLYLFVRGMCGPDTPPGAGVFAWRPPAGLVPALSDLLAGSAWSP